MDGKNILIAVWNQSEFALEKERAELIAKAKKLAKAPGGDGGGGGDGDGSFFATMS